jgi:hypothetical protein
MSESRVSLAKPEESEQDTRPEVVLLRAMTDDVLARQGIPTQPARVVEFRIGKPACVYDLRIYAIADGEIGFNTSRPEDDNSRRWVVYIDRGTTFGSAYDNKGTMYEHGEEDPGPRQQNIDTGSLHDLLSDFHDNPDAKVSYQIIREEDSAHGLALHPSSVEA